MKKFMLFASALAGLFLAASCQQDNLAPEQVSNTVKFTVEAPGALFTKAEIADGTNVNEVHYAVYKTNADETHAIGNPNEKPLAQGVVEMADKRASVNFDLLQDQEYTVIFWAQVAGKGHYTLGDLRTISVESEVLGNDETRAAFYAVCPFETYEHEDHTVTLRRPFAQLNLLTTPGSLTPVQEGQSNGYTIDVKTSEVTVVGLSKTFSTVDGMAPVAEETLTFKMNATPEEQGQETLSVNGKAYHYVSMNYFFVPEEEKLVDIEYTVVTDKGNIAHEIVAVPVKENYRTNVIGNLLTKETTFEIVVDANFEDSADAYEGGKFGVIDDQKYVRVDNAEEFNTYFADANFDIIILNDDVVLTEVVTRAAADAALKVSKGKTLTIDLNGKSLSATSAQTGKNYNMFDVNGGTLTVKNGTLESKHEGSNMGWNNSTNLFNVTAGGVLNLEGVTAKNLGGSDMAFVAHLNNWGEATLNVENSTLESTYIAVRVFNSGNDMNNVTIKNSTLNGKYCFWVHNYKGAGDNAGTDATLNLDICNGTNTFVYTGKAPILYGFNNPLYFDANGAEVVFDAATLASRLTADVENIVVVLGADIDLPINTLGQQTGGSGEYKLAGENTKSVVVDLNGHKLNVTTTYWSGLGAKNADALFTFKNGTMTSSQTSGTWNSYDLCFANCNYVFEDVVFEKAIALESAGKNFTLKNVTINETHDYYAMWISAKGQNVTVDGLTINSDGRAIKIDEQYVNEPAKVVLNVSNATFKSNKKAAIVVKSVAGAEINVDNLDITAVAADTEFAVWVDENSRAYADLVVVTGAYCKIEGDNAVIVTNAEELSAAFANSEVNCIVLGAGEYGTIVAKSNKTIVGTANAKVDAVVFNGSNNVTLKNIVFDAATAVISYDGSGNAKQYANIVNDNNGGKNTPNKGALNIVIDGCVFEGTFSNGGTAIALTDQSRSGGFSGNVIVKNCTFNTVGSYYDIYGHYVGNGQNGYGDFVIENNVFNSVHSQGLPVYLGRYASSTPVVVKGNVFETVANLAAAVYVQDHSSYGVSVNAENNTFGK